MSQDLRKLVAYQEALDRDAVDASTIAAHGTDAALKDAGRHYVAVDQKVGDRSKVRVFLPRERKD